MIRCPTCGHTTFAVYDDCDQAMCLNCQTVLFDFHMMEEVDALVNDKEGEQNGKCEQM